MTEIEQNERLSWVSARALRTARASRRRFIRPMLLALVALSGLLLVAPTLGLPALAQSTSWIATFDGAPASPQQYDPPTWDVLVHSRNSDTWKQLEPMQAHH